MGVEPIACGTVAGRESDLSLVNALHLFDNDVLNAIEFAGDDVKVEFVVHLQYHLGLDAL